MKQVVIVDYGMCNLDSVARAVEECGGKPLLACEPAALKHADLIILPGVGSFSRAAANLRERGLDQALVEAVREKQTPLLGICLGMQLMADRGFEGEECDGLGLIPGEVRRLQPNEVDCRIPHVGWNEVHPRQASPLFSGIAPGTDFYFVHSYHFCPANDSFTLATTPYAGNFASAVHNGTVFGVQFHPEKSQRTGFALITNFLAI